MNYLLKLSFLLLMALFLFGKKAFAQNNTLTFPNSFGCEYHIQQESTIQELPPLQWVIQEGKESLDIEKLQQGDLKDAQLIDLSANPVFKFKSHQPYWFNIRLTTSENITDGGLAITHVGDCWPFEFSFKNITAYSFENNNTFTTGRSGLIPSSTERDFPKIAEPGLLRIHLSQNDTLTMWVKIEKAEGCNLQVNMELLNHETIHAPRRLTTFMSTHILLIGANIALLFLSTLLYFWFREAVYIWFISFQTFLLFASLCNNFRNDIYLLFFSNSPLLFSIIAPLFAMAWICSLLQFGRVYINTKLKFPRIHTALGWAIFAFFFVTILSTLIRIFPSLAVDEWYSFRKLIIGFSLLMMFSSLVYLVWSKDKLAIFYSLGTLLPIGAILVRLIELNTENSENARDVSLIISSGVVLTMTLALGYRFKLISQQKEEAMEEKLTAEVKNTGKLKAINSAFNKFVPQTFINFLGKENILDVHLGDYVEKQVNILFSDIRDYTTLSEKMTPEENFRFVNSFNQRMGPIIQQHRGFINQYLGDGIMAIFPENPEQTLRAAIAMQNVLMIYNQERFAKNKSIIRMGIGLHTGSLIMGITGDDKRLDAATISDTVNVVSRIESLTKHFGVSLLLSDEFYQKMENKNAFHFRYLGKVLVKGKHQAIGVYECFDGNAQIDIKLKKQTLARFHEGLQHYFDKEFSKASLVFQSILAVNPDDKTTQLFLEKSNYHMLHAVEADWDGVEKMQQK